jgi:hypothetical protein
VLRQRVLRQRVLVVVVVVVVVVLLLMFESREPLPYAAATVLLDQVVCALG